MQVMNGIRSWWGDLHYASRRLLRSPSFALATVLMLALGIGFATAMYAVLATVILEPLPYRESSRLVLLGVATEEGGSDALSIAEVEAFSTDGVPLHGFGWYGWGGETIVSEQRAREVTVARVGPGFFATLGTAPLLGRTLSADEPSSRQREVVLSYREWQRQFGGSDTAIGSNIALASGDATVVGVMPAEFAFPANSVGMWLAFPSASLAQQGPGRYRDRFLGGFARLQPGKKLEDTLATLTALANRAAEEGGRDAERLTIQGKSPLDATLGNTRWVLWACQAVAVLVLFIACVNAAAMMIVRLHTRRSELAIAYSLGARPLRLARVAGFELLLLALMGGSLGAFFARLLLEVGQRTLATLLPRGESLAFDLGELGFACAATLTALACTAGIALRYTASIGSVGVSGARAIGGRPKRVPLEVMPAVSIALSTTAVAMAAALGTSLLALSRVDAGFRTQDVYALQMFRDGAPDEWRRFARAMQDRLTSTPGVEAAAVTTAAPLSVIGDLRVDTAGRGAVPTNAIMRRVSSGYESVVGSRLLTGRGIAASDIAGGQLVAVVNRTMAERLFGRISVLDQSVVVSLPGGVSARYRVVGVVDDIRNAGLRQPSQPEILVAFDQSPWVGMTFLVRSGLGREAALRLLEDALLQEAPDEGITRRYALADELASELATPELFARVLGVFSSVTLLLAGFGIYAVTAFVQRGRLAEFGLRRALGASAANIAKLVLRGSTVTVASGLAVGCVGGFLGVRAIESMLFGVGQQPLPVLALTLLIIASSALFACAAPAWAASRTDPMRALREH
jgi:predicted permease